MTVENTARGPGQGRGGNGFSFDDGAAKHGGKERRGPGGGGRGGRGDKRDGPGGSSAAYRVVNELSQLEKALTKTDFSAMKEPLSAVLRAIRPMRLKSLEQLDLATRGKLITSLMRVQRLPKPAAAEAPPADAPAVEAPAVEAPPAEGPEAQAPVEAAAAPVQAVDSKLTGWSESQFTVGLIWSSMSEADRAKAAFDNAGRQPTEADLAVPEPQPQAHAEKQERGPRKGKPERSPRGDRKERPTNKARADRPGRPTRPERLEPFVSSGDWQVDVKKMEELGRTRDAARLYEKNEAYADALRLFESGADIKAAIRCALKSKDEEAFARLSAKAKPEEMVEALERASAWEKLMQFHVARSDYESIAKLYERANQFDQAALAWEKAEKFSFARKAYERAKDFHGARRVRDLETKKLIERGDRLGAATLLMATGKREEALECLKVLPAPKAFQFMKKVKLNVEAEAFGKAEMAKAEAENNPMQRARWLELLGQQAQAAEVYLAADRKDKAAFVFLGLGEVKRAAELFETAGLLDKAQAAYAQLNDVANVERLKALPRSTPAVETAQSEIDPAADESTEKSN